MDKERQIRVYKEVAGTKQDRDKPEYSSDLGVSVDALVHAKREECGRKIRVLDIGCGQGVFLEQLMTENAADVEEVLGVDLFKWKPHTFPFKRMSAEDPFPKEFEDRFDLIFSTYVWMYLERKLEPLVGMSKLLTKEGEANIQLPSTLLQTPDDIPSSHTAAPAKKRERMKRWLEYMCAQGDPNAIRYVCSDDIYGGIGDLSTFTVQKNTEGWRIPKFVRSKKSSEGTSSMYSLEGE